MGEQQREMNNDFLKCLDDKQKKYIRDHDIENDWFIIYFVLKSGDLECDEHFYVAKGRKSRILIEHKKIWVDLTDYDLIYIFCNLDEKTVKNLLSELKKGYEGNWSKFNFILDSEAFVGEGIDYSLFDLDMEVMLEADFKVRLRDILFIFNMVLNKDIIGEHYLSEAAEKGVTRILIKRTVKKYISLILYYKYKQDSARKYLTDIEYPLYELDTLLDKKMKVKSYDANFTDAEFRQNGFDKLLELC